MPASAWGLYLVCLGATLRFFAHRALRASGLTDDQFFHGAPVGRYTREWPYSWMAHPCYVGSLLMLAGIGIIALGWSGAVLIVPAWPFYEERIRWERRMRGDARKAGVDGA